MKKKILAMLMASAMTISTVPVMAEEEITVYFSMSRYGEIVEDKNGELMAYVEVSLTGQDSYTIDDVFRVAHEEYFREGASGYASSTSEWGLGVDKLWGDVSYNFGYQVNGGTETVMGPDHVLEDGDFIDAVIYKNLYPDTEGYSTFDKTQTRCYAGDEVSVNLTYISGYDENWNSVFSPCEGAVITVNGKETDIVTDSDGNAFVKIEDEGKSIISAVKAKTVKDEVVPAITAPVLVVEAEENPIMVYRNMK